MENIVISRGYINLGEVINSPIFILRLNSCVYEFVYVQETGCLVGRTMVTQSMWDEIMGSNPSDFKGANIPVNNISYAQIQEFIAKLTELTSGHCGYRLTYKLLCEEEYESIAGEQNNIFKDSATVINAGLSTGFGGLTIWNIENSNNKPHEVTLAHPNEYGLYDMYGNLWEICTGSRGTGSAPRRDDYNNDLDFRRAHLKWKLLNTKNVAILKGGAWNMPRESCVKETFLEIGENDKFVNAGFRLTVRIQKTI